MRSALLLAVVGAYFASMRTTHAVVKYWTAGSAWSAPHNWSPTGVPLAGDAVILQPHTPLSQVQVLSFEQTGSTESLLSISVGGSVLNRLEIRIVQGTLSASRFAFENAPGAPFFDTVGTLSIAGGHLSLQDALVLGRSQDSGVLRISAGTLTAKAMQFSESNVWPYYKLEMTGGALNLGEFVIGRALPGNSGIGHGSISGGSLNISGQLNVGTFASLYLSEATNTSVGRIVSDGSITMLGKIKFTDDTLPNVINQYRTLQPGQRDLGTGGAILDHPSFSVSSTFPGVRAEVVRGYAGGNWNGDGIVSSSILQSQSSMAVGVVAGYEIFGSFGSGSFMGVPADNGDVLVRYTFAGDVNLDGAVDISDFSRLAANFNSGATWYNGDVNYDNFVRIADFALLASNFGKSLPEPVSKASIPEPLGIGIVGGIFFASLGIKNRRGRDRLR